MSRAVPLADDFVAIAARIREIAAAREAVPDAEPVKQAEIDYTAYDGA